MPPPAPTGRPAIYCSIRCRRSNDWSVRQARWAEEQRAEAERRAKEQAEQAAAERRRNLRAGGVRRLEQLQTDAWDAERCGWFEAGDKDVCQRPSSDVDVWCEEHHDAEMRAEEEALEAEWAELDDDAPTPYVGSPSRDEG